METLEFFSLTTDQRFTAKWTREQLKALSGLLREALHMRRGGGSTIVPPQGLTEDHVREVRTILETAARESYGDISQSSLTYVKEYFQAEIEMCETLVC